MFKFIPVVILAMAAGCSSGSPSCTVSCAADADCPGGQKCGALGRCSSGATCSCTAGNFLSCSDPSTAQVCNAAGNGPLAQSCAAAGCNATAGRCNACAPGAPTCGSDGNLQQCGADGLPIAGQDQTCAIPCVAAAGSTAAHCGYISPIWMPDICDTAAAMPAFDVTAGATFDTGLDTACTGGIITQTSGPAICVVRYGTITIGATLAVTGARAVAFVADGALQVTGALNVSATGTNNGPGGGTIYSGARALDGIGGGGAGFSQMGAYGGSTVDGGGGAGGAILDPLTVVPATFIGGPRPQIPLGIMYKGFPIPGGGGGGLLLVSCRASVIVDGTIAAGGGGGAGGRDRYPYTATSTWTGGTGGGAGGYVVLEGAQVVVNGLLFANGGGGGGGCYTTGCTGIAGQGGQFTTSGAMGGPASGNAGGGGNGGALGTLPGVGISGTVSPGGGGGAAGRLQVYTPAGVTPMVTPSSVSPAFEPNGTVTTR